jgi:hypothetical protein
MRTRRGAEGSTRPRLGSADGLSPLLDYIEDAIEARIALDEERLDRNLEAMRDWVLERLDR